MLTLTNCTVAKIKAALPHNNEGSIAHESDSTSGVFIYSKLREDGTPTFESEIGYTEKQTMLQNGRILLNTDIEWDFTNGGSNTGVDALLNSWKYGTVTGLEGSKHFFTPIKDDNENVIGTEKHLIYSSEIDESCLAKTQKYNRLFPQYALADNTGQLIKDANGDYILTADWYR